MTEANPVPGTIERTITNFIQLTGPLPIDEKERTKITEILLSNQGQEVFNSLSYNLMRLQKASQYETLLDAYNSNAITPGLLEILNADFTQPPETEGNMKAAAIVFKMIREGKLDFEPFRGPQDKDPEWMLYYGISFTPLPEINVPISQLQGIKEGKEKLALEFLQGKSRLLLKGHDAGTLEAVANIVDFQYQLRQKQRTRREFTAPYKRPADVGFFVNLKTNEVKDLRPYYKELRSLLAVKSWTYLKDFAKAIRTAIKEQPEEGKKVSQKPSSIFDNAAFIKLFNANPTNSIININTSKSGRPITDDAAGGYLEQNIFTKEWEYNKDGTQLTFPVKKNDTAITPPLFTTSTWKTMHFLSLLFSAQNSGKGEGKISHIVESSVREYMAATGRPITVDGVKNITKTLKRDLTTLSEFTIKSTDKKYSLEKVRPFPEVKLERGKIRVGFSPSFAEYLAKTTGFLMNYPAALLKLKENNSNLYPLGYKLAMNRSNDANIRNGRANILSVTACLECCPGIPTIENIKKHRGSPLQKIIEPFEKSMDALQEQGVLERWDYCLSKGDILNDAAVTSYEYFATLYINYEIKDFPIKEEFKRIHATEEKKRKRREMIDRQTAAAIAKKRAQAASEAETK